LLAQLPAADGDLSFLSFASDEVHGPPDRHSRPGGALPGWRWQAKARVAAGHAHLLRRAVASALV
jgi:hypothetical protein